MIVSRIYFAAAISSSSFESLPQHTNQFHVPSALSSIAPLKQMAMSKDPAQKKVGEHLLKTAAILNVLGARRSPEPFHPMLPPQMTAMN